jgi:hypothetical protein
MQPCLRRSVALNSVPLETRIVQGEAKKQKAQEAMSTRGDISRKKGRNLRVIGVVSFAAFTVLIMSINLPALASPLRVTVASSEVKRTAYWVAQVGLFLSLVLPLIPTAGKLSSLWHPQQWHKRLPLERSKRAVVLFLIFVPVWMAVAVGIIGHDVAVFAIDGNSVRLESLAAEINGSYQGVYIHTRPGEESYLYVRADRAQRMAEQLRQQGFQVKRLRE